MHMSWGERDRGGGRSRPPPPRSTGVGVAPSQEPVPELKADAPLTEPPRRSSWEKFHLKEVDIEPLKACLLVRLHVRAHPFVSSFIQMMWWTEPWARGRECRSPSGSGTVPPKRCALRARPKE